MIAVAISAAQESTPEVRKLQTAVKELRKAIIKRDLHLIERTLLNIESVDDRITVVTTRGLHKESKHAALVKYPVNQMLKAHSRIVEINKDVEKFQGGQPTKAQVELIDQLQKDQVVLDYISAFLNDIVIGKFSPLKLRGE